VKEYVKFKNKKRNGKRLQEPVVKILKASQV
jgi:hypothetical protein